jgi:hypothetical protein
LSERPHRCRTWAPRGQTPVLQYHFNWNTLSAMAGVTWWNFYFRLFPGAMRSPQIILFLLHLLRHIPGKLLIVWDGLPGHRSCAVWEFIRQQHGQLWVEFLAGLRTGTESGRVPLVSLEAPRTAQLLPHNVRPVELPRSPGPCPDAPSSDSGLRFLATGRSLSIVTILCNAQ